jgi:hypothetical protein
MVATVPIYTFSDGSFALECHAGRKRIRQLRGVEGERSAMANEHSSGEFSSYRVCEPNTHSTRSCDESVLMNDATEDCTST